MTATEKPPQAREDAVEELVNRNRNWAAAIGREVARKLPPSFDPGDLEQVAMIEMWQRAKLYDPSKMFAANGRGIGFQVYAYQYVRGAVLMSVRRRAFKDNTGDPISPGEVYDAPSAHDIVAAKQHRRNVEGPKQYRQRSWVLAALEDLQPIDAYLVRAIYFHEREVTQVAEKLGMESGQVCGDARKRTQGPGLDTSETRSCTRADDSKPRKTEIK